MIIRFLDNLIVKLLYVAEKPQMDLNTSWVEEGLIEEEVYDEEDEDEEDGEEEEEDDDDEDLDDSTEIPSTSYSVYRKKYNLLLERCNAIQQDNELLVSRVKEVKKLWKRGLRERRLLVSKLDSYGDNFRNVPIVFPVEEEVVKKVKDNRLKRGLDESSTGTAGRGRKQKGDKEKRPRDPLLPKRPQNPFFQFCKEKRETVAQDVFRSQGVNLTKKELTKILANQWNSLDSSGKTVRKIVLQLILRLFPCIFSSLIKFISFALAVTVLVRTRMRCWNIKDTVNIEYFAGDKGR